MADGAEKALRGRIRYIPDYPKKGVLFRDITPMLKDKQTLGLCVSEFAGKFKNAKIDYVVGIEARGFIIGGALACALHTGFIPIRKKGKLPYKKVSVDYELEYNKETIEVHEDAVEKGSNVLIVDDLLATGGTAAAAADLMSRLGAKITGFAFLVEISELNGMKRLKGNRVVCLVKD